MVNSEFQTYCLSNGIRLIHKFTDAYVAHLGLFINTGSRDENDSDQGIAHFIEHVIFKGTRKRKAFYVLSYLENVGGEINAYTAKEETCIYASFLPVFYDRSIELISDITFNSVFPEKEIEKEKDVVIDEINSYKDNPSESIFDDFEELIFPEHPLGRNILGKPAEVKKINKEKILKFIESKYNTDQMVVCSVGNIDFDKLIRIIEKYFSNIKPNYRSNKRLVFENYKPQTKTIKKSSYQTHCMIGNVAYNYKDDKKNALTLLNNILGGPGLNSRLNLAIREKYGFCYNLESNYTPFSDIGIWSIYLGTDKYFIDKTLSLVYKELSKLKENKLGNMQLKRAKQQLIGQVAIAHESNLTDMLSIGKSYMIYNKVDTLEEIYNKIEQVTAEQLLESANEIFNFDNLSTLIYKAK